MPVASKSAVLLLLSLLAHSRCIRGQNSSSPASGPGDAWSKTWGFDDGLLLPIVVYKQSGVLSCGNSCPVAQWALRPEAGYKSGTGLRIIINSSETTDAVQVIIPKFLLDPGRHASVCFYARHSNPEAYISMAAIRFTTNSVDAPYIRNGMSFQRNNTWQRFCIKEIEFIKRTVFGIKMDVAAVSGVLDIDEINLTVQTPFTPAQALATAQWMNATDQRILDIRRGNLTLLFRDQETDAPLKSLPGGLQITLAKHDFLFGTAFSPESVKYLPAPELKWYLARTLDFPFNALVPENLFKWSKFEPTRGGFIQASNTLNLDYFKWVKKFKTKITHVRGHALEWFRKEDDAHWSRVYGCSKYPAFIEERITRDVSMAGAGFNSYDVINELLNEWKFYKRCNFNLTMIANMFKLAAAAAPPGTELCVNDYRIIEADFWPDYIDLIQKLQDEGAPINCIGIQAHLTFGAVMPATMKMRLDKVADLGLPIYITEVSLRTGYDADKGAFLNRLDPAVHATWLSDLYRMWFSHPAIKGIWLWGFWDKLHYIPNGGIFNSVGRAKPAALALQTLLRVRWNTTVAHPKPIQLSTRGGVRVRAFYGTYLVKVAMGPNQLFKFSVEFPKTGGDNQIAVIRVPKTIPQYSPPPPGMGPAEGAEPNWVPSPELNKRRRRLQL